MTAYDHPIYKRMIELLEPSEHEWPVAFLHYTTLPALEKMLGNKEQAGSIFLANALCQQDPSEYSGNLELANDIIKEIALREPNHRKASLFHDLSNYFHSSHLDDVDSVHIFSMSEAEPNSKDGDLLMWRVYGNEGRGVALRLSSSPFKDNRNDASFPVYLSKVVYQSSDEFNSVCEYSLGQVWDLCERGSAKEAVFHDFYSALSTLAAVRKHNGFRGEREWRFVFSPLHDWPENQPDPRPFFIKTVIQAK